MSLLIYGLILGCLIGGALIWGTLTGRFRYRLELRDGWLVYHPNSSAMGEPFRIRLVDIVRCRTLGEGGWAECLLRDGTTRQFPEQRIEDHVVANEIRKTIRAAST